MPNILVVIAISRLEISPPKNVGIVGIVYSDSDLSIPISMLADASIESHVFFYLECPYLSLS